MATGKVKWYNESKGFGFIETKENGDVFVHRSKLLVPFNGLSPDQEVVFDLEEGQKGLVAVNVKSV
jgi:CspA family cold shock protein